MVLPLWQTHGGGGGWLYPLCYNYGPVPSSTSLSRGKAKRYRVCCLIIPACIHCPSSMHHCSVKCRINFIASREMDSSSWCSVRPRGRLCYDTWIASPGTLIVEVSRFLVVGGGGGGEDSSSVPSVRSAYCWNRKRQPFSVNMTADCNDSGPCFSCCLELGLDGFMGQAHLNKKLEAQRMSNLSNFIYKVEEE